MGSSKSPQWPQIIKVVLRPFAFRSTFERQFPISMFIDLLPVRLLLHYIKAWNKERTTADRVFKRVGQRSATALSFALSLPIATASQTKCHIIVFFLFLLWGYSAFTFYLKS